MPYKKDGIFSNGEKRKKERHLLEDTARGAPYSLAKIAYESARQNGGSRGNNDPSRLLKKDDKPSNKSSNDRYYQGIVKGTANRTKEKEKEERSEANERLRKLRASARKY